MEQTINRNELKRLHIGGLTSAVTVEELKEKFNSFGTIQDVEIKTKKDVYGDDFNTFAYMDIISDESALNKCFSIFNKAKWKGRSLKIHLAKEHFLKRLDEERKCPVIPVVKKVKSNFHNPLALIPEVEDFNMKGKVPGTPIPGEKKWVVGKYGRILPIVNVRNRSLNKCIYYDPSKYCHNLKKLKEEEENERLIDIDELTWRIESDTNSSKRRCGDFSGFDNYVPKRVKLNEDYWSDDMQEKMEELRRRYLKTSEEIPQKFENDIEIVKSGKKVSSEYHIPKTDFIYGSDEELSNDEEQIQHLSVLGEPTSCGYDSAGSADTDEIIAMNASKNKTNCSIPNKAHTIPLETPEVNETDSKIKIDQVVTVDNKSITNNKLPVKKKLEIEIALSYIDNAMKQIPFRGMAMLDCVSTETVSKTVMENESNCNSVSESDSNSVSESDSGESDADNSLAVISKLNSKRTAPPNLDHSGNDSDYDSDDFEKVALKYSSSLSVLEDSALGGNSDQKLEKVKTDFQDKNDSNKMLTASDSEDTDDMIKKLKNNYDKTTKLIVAPEKYSNDTETIISMTSKIPNKRVIPTDSDLDSDDFEKVAEKYSSFIENTTQSPILKNPSKSVNETTRDEESSSESDMEIIIKDRKLKVGKTLNIHANESILITENSKIRHDIDDDTDDDDGTVDNATADKSHNINTAVERNITECKNKKLEENIDNDGCDVKNKGDDNSNSDIDGSETNNDDVDKRGDDESSNDDKSGSGEDSDDDDEGDEEDNSETNNDVNKQENGESNSSDSGESDDHDDSDRDSDDSDDDDKDDDDNNSDKDSDDSDDGDKDNDDDNSDKDSDDDGDKDSDDDGDKDSDDDGDKDDEESDGDNKKKDEKGNTCERNKNFFVSSSLFGAFVKPEKDNNSGFSFLKTFGKQNLPEPQKLELPRHLRKNEETESFIYKRDEIEEKRTSKSSSSFFFQPKDIRLQEGVQFFHRKMDIDEIEDKWNEVKPVFLATCRQRNRLALKRLDQEKLKKRKMSFTKSFMSKNRK